jgi:hypothetical protein
MSSGSLTPAQSQHPRVEPRDRTNFNGDDAVPTSKTLCAIATIVKLPKIGATIDTEVKYKPYYPCL